MNRTGLEEVINFVQEMSEDKHICLVYETEDDLVEILVPYFEKGLENNEVCIWVLSDSILTDDVKKVLKTKIPDLDVYIEKEQMIFLYSKDLYEKYDKFDIKTIMQFWAKKEKQALDKGFKGLRVSGSPNGKEWIELVKYEELLNNKILKKPIKAICTYSNKIAGLLKILAVGAHHSKVIVSQEDKWQIVDVPNSKALLEKLEKPYLKD